MAKGRIMRFPDYTPLLRLALVLLVTACQPAPTDKAQAPELTEDEKAIYSYGVVTGQRVGVETAQLRLTPQELAAFQSGLNDAVTGKKPQVRVADYEQRFQELAQARLQSIANLAQREGADAMAAAIEEKGAIRTDSGVVYRQLRPGKGTRPKASDSVRVQYTGTLPDGTVFDSSEQREEASEFSLSRVIPCWSEGLQLMQVGERAKLVCPPSTAYGDTGAAGGKIPPNATLIFDVELVNIVGK
jgi:FKBP-type peptidyl-prolyl cis-trans isomerase FkpA